MSMSMSENISGVVNNAVVGDVPEDLKFETYRNVTLTKARLLTDKDRLTYGTHIATAEGLVAWEPGDYLAVGVRGEIWPISGKVMAATKLYIEDAYGGWGIFKNTYTVKAAQIKDHHFKLTLADRENGIYIHGRPGDWVVMVEAIGGLKARQCVVGDEIFKRTYVKVVD